MMVLSARYREDDQANFDRWSWANSVIKANLTPKMQQMAREYGYEGLFDLVPEHFGLTRMYRCAHSHITYEFTDAQWTMFVLRWS